MTAAWVAVLSVLGLTILVLPNRHGTNAEVVGVVNGDTVIVHDKVGDRRIRLLNVDTPKSMSPTAKPSCLATEATSELRRLLPAGAKVKIAFDGEHRDRYGRDLAGVFLTNGRLVNAEIARAGLGNPVDSDRSTTYLNDVSSAQNEAFKGNRGFFDPAQKCTVPGQIRTIQSRLHKAAAARPSSVAEAKVVEVELAGAVSDAKALSAKLKSPPEDSAWLAYSGDRLTVVASSVSTIIKDGVAAEADVRATADGLSAGGDAPTPSPTDAPAQSPTDPPTASGTDSTSPPATGGSGSTPSTPPKRCLLPNGKYKKHCK